VHRAEILIANPIKFSDPEGLAVVICCGMTSRLPRPQVMVGLECMSKCLQTTIFIRRTCC
jgi:hypothetical protein